MSGARNWSIGKRLGAGFGAILVLVIGANLVSWSALSGSGAHLRAAQSAQLGTAALAEAQSLLWQLRWSVAQYMVIDEAGRAKIVAEEAGVGARLEEQLNAYAKLPRTAAESEALKELLVAYRKYMDARPKWFQLYGAGKLDEAKEWRAATTTPFGAATVKGFFNLIEAQKKAIAADAAEAEQHARTAGMTLLGAGLVAALLVVLLAWWLTRSITRPVREVREVIERAQQTSDLTLRAGASGKDEVAAMAHAYNALMQSLQTTLRTVLASARDVSASATTVATASNQVSSSSRAQSESAATTAAAVEEVTVSLAHVVDSTRDAASVSEQASTLSTEGERSALEAAKQMNATVESVGDSMRTIENLSRRSSEISGIVKVIGGIAEQTNLLALNAAIEAARAGEQGRGFAVVADEVRKLAELTSNSTSEISAMIAGIQGEIDQTVTSLRVNNERVLQGKAVAEQVATTLSRINAGAGTTLEQIRGISQAAAEQSSAYTDIARNVENIARMSEETSLAIVQTNDAATRLDALATSLHGEVARFKV